MAPEAELRRRRLDDPTARAAIDVSDALSDVEGAVEQWKTARDVDLPELDWSGLRAAVVCGVGGSGVAGDVVAALADERCPLPVVVRKGSRLPGWVGPDTLVVACSHSGRTAETLQAAAAAHAAGAPLLAVCAGGPLAELGSRGRGTVHVPTGPPPRHALGALVVPLLRLLGVDEGLDEAVDALQRVRGAWGRDVPGDANPGKQLGTALADGSLPVVFGGAHLAAVVAGRLKTQLNENAKLPVVLATMPELAHHEVMGWEVAGPLDGRARLVHVRDAVDEADVDRRRHAHVDALLAARGVPRHELAADGTSPLARLATLLLRADLVSVYTAIARGVDPTPIATIDALKTLGAADGPAVRRAAPD